MPTTAPTMTISSYPGHYSHGINIRDWYPCWNLALDGCLRSPDFAAHCDPGLAAVHTSIRDIPIKSLRKFGTSHGVLSPRASWYVWAAAVVRNRGHIEIGLHNPTQLSRDDLERIVRIGDIELEFEAFRRDINPDAPSRLSSLYAADDTSLGHAHIRQMLGPQALILRVSIPAALRVTKVDTAWFDRYVDNPNPEFIRQYWRSVPSFQDCTTWEYLIDGMIQVDDPDGLAYIRKHGAHLALVPQNSHGKSEDV